MVQEMGVWLLQREDRIRDAERKASDLKYAIIASGDRDRPRAEDYFPEYFRSPVQDLDFGDDSVDYDFSDVEWETPEGMSAEELADLESFLGGQVTVPGNEEWF